jgi:hypothetical protein
MLYRIALCTAAALFCCGSAHATVIKHAAGPVQQVLVASDITHYGTQVLCSTGWVDLPGTAVKITTPSGQTQLLVARFSGQLTASEGNPGVLATGALRIVVGTRELNPAGERQPVTSNANPFQPPVAIESSGPVTGGVHTVKAQWCLLDGDGSGAVLAQGYHLTVEAAPLP